MRTITPASPDLWWVPACLVVGAKPTLRLSPAPAGAMCGCKVCYAPVDPAQPSTAPALQPLLSCCGCSQLLLSECTSRWTTSCDSQDTRWCPPSTILTGLPLLPAAKCILKWAVQRDNCWCPQCKAPFQYLFTYRNLDGSLNDFPQEESVVLLKRAEWFVATLKVSLGANSTEPC